MCVCMYACLSVWLFVRVCVFVVVVFVRVTLVSYFNKRIFLNFFSLVLNAVPFVVM